MEDKIDRSPSSLPNLEENLIINENINEQKQSCNDDDKNQNVKMNKNSPQPSQVFYLNKRHGRNCIIMKTTKQVKYFILLILKRFSKKLDEQNIF